MKKVLLLIVVLGVMASAAWIGGERYGLNKQGVIATAPVTSVASVDHPTPPPVNRPPPLMATSDWPKYRNARQAALEANPELQAEYNEILKEMDAQQAKLDAAMVKVDPSISPVIAKLVALRQKNGAPAAPVPGKPVAGTSVAPLTQDDLQELRTARAEALQANPNLTAVSKETKDKMRSFEDNLDAAMVKVDPSVSTLIAQFEAGGKPAVASVNSPGAK